MLFCGRDNESFDVSRLIDNNIFVTLYGRSGTGKTSLLNAGIFPRLRQEHYFPVSIRLGMEGRETSFQQSIISRVTGDLQKAGGTIRTTEVVPLGQDEQAPEYLWRFFARSQFLAREGHVVFPVIVLDQFEEVLHRQTDETEVLLRQIHFMMDEGHALPDTVVDGEPYIYDFNFRFVISIREDDLYRLEDSIDNNFLPEMKSCRFRLRNLSEQGGRDAILIPGGDLFRSDERDKIADTILSLARNRQDNSINANILSLICSRIFVEYQRSGAKEITLDLVDKFIRSNPFETLYNEATAGLSNREKNYIETHLVDSEGRRDSIPESDFFRHIKSGEKLFTGDTKILQRTFVSSDANRCRIELVHDSFCEPLSRLKEKREKKKRTQALLLGIAIGLAGVLLGGYLYHQNRTLKATQAQLSSQGMELLSKVYELDRTKQELEKNYQELQASKAELEAYQQDLEAKIRELRRTQARASVAEHRADAAEQRADSTEIQYNQMLMRMLANENQADKAHQQDSLSGPGAEEVDNVGDIDIEFTTDSPDKATITEWAKKYHDVCTGIIAKYVNGFNIPYDMVTDHPCLVYLILSSKSIASNKEKQSWFDLYSLMNQDQIDKLYNILYRERYKLAEIEARYQARQAEIDSKYNTSYKDLLAEYEDARLKFMENRTEENRKSYEECQDKLLEYTQTSFNTGEPYVDFLRTALDDCELLYSEDPSFKSRFVRIRNRVGELYLRTGKILDGMGIIQQDYELDPEQTKPFLAAGYNQMMYYYAQRDDFRNARRSIDKAISIAPKEPNYYDSKGELYLMQDDDKNALKMWKKVIKLDPDFLSKHRGRTALYAGLLERGLL